MDSSSLRALLGVTAAENKKKAVDSLIFIFDNILRTRHQQESQFRRINISSKSFTENIMTVPGALDILFEIGFEEDSSSNEHLVFPFGHSVERLQEVRNCLVNSQIPPASVDQSADGAQSGNQSNANMIRRVPSNGLCSTTKPPPRIGRTTREQADFRNMLVSYSNQVLRYEDSLLQTKIRNTVPFDRLKETAAKMAQQSNEFIHSSATKQAAILRSCFLFTLLKWFKEEFFQWVNQPKCDNCSGDTAPLPMHGSNTHLNYPTPEESRFGASRIELYNCLACRTVARFPRYNDPGKLLETRRGRCGEWANCFTAVCRAAGFEARYVMDNADHLWTEVFSDLENRWLHCDSCETALDQPLMYEAGWGKKLSYVFAFSKNEIADVSWRYAADHTILLQRRTQFPEEWLKNAVIRLNKIRQGASSKTVRDEIDRRRLQELMEFLTPNSVKDNEKSGRTSGSLTWRLARGEMGLAKLSDEAFVITPTDAELSDKYLKLTYISSSDMYCRGNTVTEGFKSCTFKCANISRKVENDWRMAYLARVPGSPDGEIMWRFQCPTSAAVKSFKLRLPKTEFESGKITVTVKLDDQTSEKIVSEYFTRSFGQTTGQPSFRFLDITAKLTKGSGDVAWQHTQLFRESLDAPGSAGFELEVEFY